MFIVGGHEHEPEFSELTDSRAAVMKGASNARRIWRIDVDFDAAGMPGITTQLIDVDTSIPSDPEYDELDGKWRSALLDVFPFLTARVGEAAVPLDAREVTIRNQESNWGNFVVDQMRGAFGKPEADLAFINSGTLRIDDFIADDIAFRRHRPDLRFLFLPAPPVVTGAEFVDILEAGYRGTGPEQGLLPAGVRIPRVRRSFPA